MFSDGCSLGLLLYWQIKVVLVIVNTGSLNDMSRVYQGRFYLPLSIFLCFIRMKTSLVNYLLHLFISLVYLFNYL